MKKNILTLAFASLAIMAGSSCSKEFDTVLNKELSKDTDISEYLPVITRGSVNLGTFNLLNSSASEAGYEWSTRKNVLAKAIVENDFDIFGVEEVDNTVGRDLPGLVQAAAPDGSTRNYEWWIVRRDSQAADKGEGIGIVYDANKFTLSEQHYFWLTEKDPDVMNYGWDEKEYRRMACCAVVTETATGKQFFMMVTHMPLAAMARQGAAALINAREALYNTGKLPAFLVGDMNAAPDDPASDVFSSAKWNDSYEKVPVVSRVGQVITFHGKKAITDMTAAENRIDYVYYKNLSKVLTYKVDYNTYGGYYPSDHCPVSVTFDLPQITPPIGGIKGSGSEADPFQIASVEDWNKVAGSINGGGAYAADAYYKLTSDLLFAGDFTRIALFNGTLNGNNHSLKNITGEADQETFGGVINVLDDGGVVKNMYVEATLSSAFKNLGGVIGMANAGSLIDGVTFKGDLTGTGDASRLGGIAGTGCGVIVNCGCLGGKFEAGSATKSENMGGIAGRIEQITAMVFNCYSFLDKIVSSNNNLGGIAGGLGTDAYCANVYGTTIDITGGGTYGGCIGYSKSGNVRNVYTSEEAAFNGGSTKWVANDKQASDWKTSGASITLANMKSGAVSLPSSGASYDSFVAALNAGIEDWNALENIAAKKGAGVEPYGIVNKPNVVLRKWVVDPATGYPVVSNEAGSSEDNTTKVVVDFNVYGPEQNWTDAQAYTEFVVGGITFTASCNAGASANGMYYSSVPADWRFYQARGGGLTVSAPEGHSFVKALFTYNNKNEGVLIAPDGTVVETGVEFAFSGSSATFTVGSTTSGVTNAQARIYTITLEYK